MINNLNVVAPDCVKMQMSPVEARMLACKVRVDVDASKCVFGSFILLGNTDNSRRKKAAEKVQMKVERRRRKQEKTALIKVTYQFSLM